MRFINTRRTILNQAGIEGLLIVLAFAPFAIFSNIETGFIENFRPFIALLSSAAFIASAWFILKLPLTAKILAGLAATGTVATLIPELKNSPGSALAVIVIYVLALASLSNYRISERLKNIARRIDYHLQRARWAAGGIIALAFFSFLFMDQVEPSANLSLVIAVVFAQAMSLQWVTEQKTSFYKLFFILVNFILLLGIVFFSHHQMTWIGALGTGFALLILMPADARSDEELKKWWEPLINHPARLTLVSFFMLCVLGTLFLTLPVSAASEAIKLIDAAFTSVSAVCVTGLIVLDTPNDFSFMGQFFIILLIQLGGLGTMTVSSLALVALGRKFSLKQERILVTSFNSDYQNLAASIFRIVKFTMALEATGAIVLSLLFYRHGFQLSDSIWRGCFTSISAFCNAGFALQSDSLVQFQKDPLILHTVAALIISGGIAPATALLIPRWASGKSISVSASMSLLTTLILLVSGTVFILVFEWNGILGDLSFFDKLHNAWFQSTTLRTAGFNSVALENILGPTFMLMVSFMFIGGSPGGTAGGIKTTTFAVIVATFWSTITGNDNLVIQNRRVVPKTVNKAITTMVAGILTLITIILMLQATQLINARGLAFEAFSALGTVGLSLGATSELDSIGKIIIMFAMFSGRVGPLTLLTMLGRKMPEKSEEMLEARVNLT